MLEQSKAGCPSCSLGLRQPFTEVGNLRGALTQKPLLTSSLLPTLLVRSVSPVYVAIIYLPISFSICSGGYLARGM